MGSQRNMTTGHPGKLIFLFALPLMLGSVFQQLYTVVDTAIVGQGVGMEALAALGTVDWLNWMFLSIAQGFTQGFSVRVAQKFGQGDQEGLKKAIGLSAVLSVIIAFVVSVCSQWLLISIMELLKVPVELRPLAERYTRILLAGFPVVLLYNYCASVLRAVGDSKTPLIAMAVAALANIMLDCIAVFVLDWGIEGAAAATVAAQLLSALICLIKMRKMSILHIQKTHLRLERKLTGILIGLSAPIALQNVIIAVGGMTMQSVVNGFETDFIAGYTATNKLFGLLEMAAMAYGYAITTYAGQNFGAGLWQRIRRGVRWATWISIFTAALIGLCMVLFGRQITGLFLSSEAPELVSSAKEIAYEYLCLLAVMLWILYLLHVYRSSLQGMGDTKIPLASGIIEFVLRVGMAFGIPLWGFREGVFWAEPLAWLGAVLLLMWAYFYRVRKWK